MALKLTLFGDCQLSREAYAAMAPHVKTEALLLAAEAGVCADDLAMALDERTDLVNERMSARHRFSPWEREGGFGQKTNRPRPTVASGLSRYDDALLRMIAAAPGGTVQMSAVDMEEAAGLPSRRAETALRHLLDQGLILRSAPRGRPRPYAWSLTEAGRMLVETTAEEMADAS